MLNEVENAEIEPPPNCMMFSKIKLDRMRLASLGIEINKQEVLSNQVVRTTFHVNHNDNTADALLVFEPRYYEGYDPALLDFSSREELINQIQQQLATAGVPIEAQHSTLVAPTCFYKAAEISCDFIIVPDELFEVDERMMDLLTVDPENMTVCGNADQIHMMANLLNDDDELFSISIDRAAYIKWQLAHALPWHMHWRLKYKISTTAIKPAQTTSPESRVCYQIKFFDDDPLAHSLSDDDTVEFAAYAFDVIPVLQSEEK